MTLHDSPDGIGRRLKALDGSSPIWPKRKTGYRSVLVNDLHDEWSIHYLTSYGTLVSAHQEITTWLANTPENSLLPNEKISAPALIFLDRAVSALEAKNLDKLFALTRSVIENAARILGFAIVVDVFEAGGTFEKIKAILNIEQAEFTITDDLLHVIDSSMQRILTFALLVEAQAGALTGRFGNLDRPRFELVANWKAPIVARMRAERKAFEDAGIRATLLKVPGDGHWPAGLEAEA